MINFTTIIIYIIIYTLNVASVISLFYLCWICNLTVQKSYILLIAVIIIYIISYLSIPKGYINRNKDVTLMKHCLFIAITSSIILVTFIVFIPCNVIDYSNPFLFNNAEMTTGNYPTLEEKKAFLLKSLVYLVQQTSLTDLHLAFLFDQIDCSDYLNHVTTLKTIAEDTEILVRHMRDTQRGGVFTYEQSLIVMEDLYQKDFPNVYYFLRNSFGILAIFYTIDYYHTLYCIYKNLADPQRVFDLIELIKHYYK